MITRRGFLATWASLVVTSSAALWPTAHAQTTETSRPVFEPPKPWAARLIGAAERRIGRTILYDPAYVRLTYPMGDVPDDRGVCTDVIIRAYRDGLGVDLQRLVHEDMKRNFSAYPANWGLKQPDHNIDHRRVPNLEKFFRRAGADLPVTPKASDYRPGDVVSQILPGNLTHMVLVTHHANKTGERPLIIHNIGSGTRLEDRLFEFRITGHYRYSPDHAGETAS